jgi:hypothetical protein
MTESNSDEKKDPKASRVVLKSIKIQRPRVIRKRRTKPDASHDEPVAIDPIDADDIVSTPPVQTSSINSEEIPSAPILQETVSSDFDQPVKSSLWNGAQQSSQSSFSFFDRIFQPNIQYKLFLLFLSIWGASFIMFYLSTTFAIILPEPFNLVVLGFFLISTSLSAIYTFLLGLQHLRNTRSSSDDNYY